MTIEQKAWLTTFITVFLGFALLKVPYVGFLIECVILLICIGSIYDTTYDFYKEETKKQNKAK